MLGKQTFELLDKVGKIIRKHLHLPFGGLQVIFSGDFLQLPPINDEFVFKSQIWDLLNMKYFKLIKPKRYPDEQHFFMLQRIRLGKPSSDDIKKLKSRVGAYIDYVGNGTERKEKIKPTRIFSLKKDVEKYNIDELNKLPTEPVSYTATDTFLVKSENKNENEDTSSLINTKKQLTTKEKLEYSEFLNTVTPSQLVFKPDAQVMLTYNLDISEGLVNGSRGVVITCNIEDKSVDVLFRNGNSVKITPQVYEFEDGKIKITRTQIPLILAYGSSIHRSQGATIDYAIIDLGSSIFSPGMAYVALSRVKTLDGLLLSNLIPSKLIANKDSLEFEELIETLELIKDEEGDE